MRARAAEHAIRTHAAEEAIRVAQQGRGRPIVSARVGDHTIVATGSTIHWSKTWKTFVDFLSDYIKRTLGSDWGNAEMAKPLAGRHPILQWYDAVCRYQAAHQAKQGEVFVGEMTGALSCYYGLAYSLYLLHHNVELQERLVARLKDIRQFQGAYYELMVANGLIRAGFQLELEDEADDDNKHCEFSARSETTGTRYWVECKMRSVPGLLGKTRADGSASRDPTSKMTDHIREALLKPAPDRRMIFVDLNGEPLEDDGKPVWLAQAVRRLEARERDLEEGQEAYVFVTNMAFHRVLDDPTGGGQALAYGLGLADFGKPGEIRLSEWYRQKRKHIDAHKIVEAFQTYQQLPDTLDGRAASEAFSQDGNARLRIGETYFFEDAGEGGTTGTVTSVAVIKKDKTAMAAVTTNDGHRVLLAIDLSDAELQDYEKYGDAYFGEPKARHHESKDILEFYEWLVECYAKTPRERLLELAAKHPEIERLRALDRDDIVLELCEAWAAPMQDRQLTTQANT
ncbi:hypothetical protein AUC68_07075 [Methyloceanibacter methanicus]|uniref:Uncharacterized protein n=1 Tax=Methyloceanibacter methanicus TaxID=1774968 RepID=A0A1E3W1B5_9HYPH|nr:hypothetical protein [Methyloceanibacter methanicus]ODR98926.1 hypothetical protein AUC68_07075 [Methyloceanibacter methanicus]